MRRASKLPFADIDQQRSKSTYSVQVCTSHTSVHRSLHPGHRILFGARFSRNGL